MSTHRKAAPSGAAQEVQKQADRCRDGGKRATSESKAKEDLKLERARQRTAIRRLNAAREDAVRTTAVLRNLLVDPAFVALLRVEELVSIPRLVRQRLMEQP
jgi:hypothetical protein